MSANATVPPPDFLHSAWHTSSPSEPKLLLLEGAAGIGKSHMVRAFARQTNGASLTLNVPCAGWLAGVLRACHAQLEPERDPSFLEAARRIVPDLRWAHIAQAAALTDQNALWNVIAHALERLASRAGGLILLLEDAHQANPEDLGALRAVYRRALLGKAPVMIVLTTRPSEQDLLEGFAQDAAIADAPGPQRHLLSSLDGAGMDALLREHLHSEFLPENLAAWLQARTEGHPLHTLELLRFLRDGGALQDLGVSWVFEPPKGKALPKTLEASLMARVANAKRNPQVWRALSALCVIERQVSLSDWAKLCDQDEGTLLEVANRLEYQGLLRESLAAGQSAYVVAHPLYPPLVRAQLEPTELEGIHRRAMGISGSIGERAKHARACTHEDSLELSRLALEDAKVRFAHSEVVEQAQFLLRQEIADPSETLQDLINAFKELGRYESILELSEADDSSQGLLNRILSLEYLGRSDGLRALVETGFSNASEPQRTPLGLVLARLLITAHELERAEGILETLRPNDDLGNAQLMYERARLYNTQNEPIRALEAIERAETLVRRHGGQRFLLLTLIQKNNFLTLTERHTECAQLETEIMRIAEEYGSVAHLTNAYQTIGFSFVSRGRYPLARAPFARALRLAQSIKQPTMIASAYVNASIPEYAAARAEAARTFIGRGIEIFNELEQYGMANSMMLYRAFCESLLGNVEAVRSFLASDAVKEPEKLYSWHQQAAAMYLNVGEFGRAREILDQAPIDSYTPDSLGDHEYQRALLSLIDGETGMALDYINRALGHIASVGNDSEFALMRFARAIINLRLQNTEVARTEAREALEVVNLNQVFSSLMPLERLFPDQTRALRQHRDATVPSTETNSSFLRTLGSFSLERDGHASPWKAAKTRELLAHLLVAYLREDGPSVPKAQLIDAIWPESGGDEENKFRVTLKRLRQSLGDAANIHGSNGLYELRDLNADVTHFLTALERLDLDAALGWYGGSFLPEVDVIDAQLVRAQLWQRFRDAALHASLERPALAAANLLEKLHHLEPLDVTVIERLAQSLRAANDPYRLEQTLSRARMVFEREIGEVPVELVVLERA